MAETGGGGEDMSDNPRKRKRQAKKRKKRKGRREKQEAKAGKVRQKSQRERAIPSRVMQRTQICRKTGLVLPTKATKRVHFFAYPLKRMAQQP